MPCLLALLALSPALASASTAGAGGVVGIIIGLGIWIAMFGFGIVFYAIRCECYRVCAFCCPKQEERLPIPESPQEPEVLP
jgi:sulfite exporter TauE/SafE